MVISHNQVNLIKRCVESVIKQPVHFPYEIIMSDDTSTDGTWDIVQEYAAKYPEAKEHNGLYTPRIIATQMNSSDYNPVNKSMRGGWNRSHACQFAHGKYMTVLDADDSYKEGAHNLADQVAILEKHPECSLCMENIYYLNKDNGDDFSKATLWFPKDFFWDERIITAEDYIMKNYFMNTTAFMYRWNKEDSLAQYGGRTVDVTMTSHFLQFGDIVCYDSADYVYEQYASSTSHAMIDDDMFIFWEQGLYISALMPKLKHWYILSRLKDIQLVASACRHDYVMKPHNKRFIDGMDVYVFDAFNRKHTIFDKIRLRMATFIISRMRIHNWTSRVWTSILYKLLIR